MGGIGTNDMDRVCEKMDSKEIVRRLVVGSGAIDRMRTEIDTVIKGVIGLVEREERMTFFRSPSRHSLFDANLFHEVFYSSECEWRIFGDKQGSNFMASHMVWRVECFLKRPLGDPKAYSS